jgi:site-specific DNA recombinase
MTKRKTAPAAASRVVGYCRVSTEGQAEEGISLDAQQEKIVQYAETYDLRLVGVFVDAGLSAKNLEREGLRDALRYLKKKRADGLVVVKLDRLTRSVRDLGELIETYFGKDGAQLISINERLDTSSPAGRLMLHILGSVSQWEREAIGERTRDALAHLRDQGVQLGGTPLGFERLEDVDDAGRRVLRAVKDEQATVALITKLHARGLSLREIAAELAENGRRTKRGGRWQAQTIANVLARAAAADVAKERA